MELAEVVNPHFAVPVVGVVVCALLVFAFGFKSSVQPPSFDFEKDEKHRLRQKTRKPKVMSRLHYFHQYCNTYLYYMYFHACITHEEMLV